MPAKVDLRSGQSAGFTLLEVVVAVAILGIMLTALYGSFSRTLTTKALAEQRADLSRSVRSTLYRMAEDIQGSLPGTPTNQASFRSKDFTENHHPRDTLTFTSLSRRPFSHFTPEPDQRGISYFVEADQEHPGSAWLMRREILALHSDADGRAFPLLPQVQGVRFRFFDGREWREEWNPEDRPSAPLPQAVEISLLVESTGEVQEFTTMVDVPLAHDTE